jgi:serine/threonine protein kinase
MTLAGGVRLGPYEIRGLLGAGGMGEVYRAHDTRLGRDVAVKVLPAEFASDTERLRRFEQEARAAAALNHPSILILHDLGNHEGAPYIVTELLEGQTLRQKLREGPMTPASALEVGVQIAHGMAAAHEKGIVHRDIKPENLFITNDGQAKILDFGLARLRSLGPIAAADSEAATVDSPTRRGMILGTIGYASPEQAQGKPIDARTDIFSFGAVLYEMVTGRRAFEGDSPVSVLSAILTGTPPPATTVRQGVPTDLDHILERCLAKDPERRYKSAEGLRKDLAACLDALLHRRISLKRLLRNPRTAVPLVLLFVAAVVGVTWLAVRSVRQRTARREWVPEIVRLAEARDYWPAFLLARKAEAVLGDDPLLVRPLEDATSRVEWVVSLRVRRSTPAPPVGTIAPGCAWGAQGRPRC